MHFRREKAKRYKVPQFTYPQDEKGVPSRIKEKTVNIHIRYEGGKTKKEGEPSTIFLSGKEEKKMRLCGVGRSKLGKLRILSAFVGGGWGGSHLRLGPTEKVKREGCEASYLTPARERSQLVHQRGGRGCLSIFAKWERSRLSKKSCKSCAKKREGKKRRAVSLDRGGEEDRSPE